MPIAKFSGVSCCSSEDKNHLAANLLNENVNKKWIGDKNGLESNYVILELEQSTQINGIDIGNENSAYIEVFVGKKSWQNDDFKNILITSSFMTPAEGRNSENKNRVRCFPNDELVSDVRNEKWNFVKILCTQPFNKHVQYGVSFIKIHTNDLTTSTANCRTMGLSPKVKPKLSETLDLPTDNPFSQFKMREDSSDSDKELGSLFQKHKQTKNEKPSSTNALSSAAAIREAAESDAKLEKYTTVKKMTETPKQIATKSVENKSEKQEEMKKDTNRNRNSLMYNDEDEITSKPKHEKLIDIDKKRIESEKDDKVNKQKDVIKKETNREDISRKKIEASSSKFNVFLNANTDNNRQDNDQKEITNESISQASTVAMESNESSKTAIPAINSSQSSASTSSSSSQKQNSNKRKSSVEDDSDESSGKRNKTSPSDEQKIKINTILQGVVLVISGIQNPERADIRDKALQMGAKYRSDWNNGCTHLICAFKNTPKYKQVQNNGIIVSRQWIVDCFTQKKKLPWQDYAL